jgi:Mn-dependent DtxR family transcriptional regulator
LDAETQQRDIEGIEHHLSLATVEVLANLAAFFEQNPEILERFLRSTRRAGAELPDSGPGCARPNETA